MPGGIPICIFEADLALFRVLHAKGKSLSSGGYGIAWSIDRGDKNKHMKGYDMEVEEEVDSDTKVELTPKSTGASSDFLFIEEALFLHERGLLQVLDHAGQNTLDTSELYEIMLKQLNFPLPVYLTYSRLRAQTFIVLRHTKKRLSIIKEIQQQDRLKIARAQARVQEKVQAQEQECQVDLLSPHPLTPPLHIIASKSIAQHEGDHNENQNDDQNLNHDQSQAKGKTNVMDEQKSQCPGQAECQGQSSTQSQSNRQNQDEGQAHVSNAEGGANKANLEQNPVVVGMNQISSKTSTSTKQNHKKTLKEIRFNLRQDAFEAPTPHLLPFDSKDKGEPSVDCLAIDNTTIELSTSDIAYDVYNPNSNFRKTNPGLPDYCVAITPYALPSPQFDHMCELVKECDDIPLQIAAVSDSGTVIMFGLTDFSVPSISSSSN